MNPQLIEVLVRVFKTDPKLIVSESSPQTLEGWDYLSHLELMLELEETFGVRFTTQQMAELTTVSGVEAALEGLGAIPGE